MCVVCVCASSDQKHPTQFIDWAFISFYWSPFNLPTLAEFSWVQSIDVARRFMFFLMFRAQHGKKYTLGIAKQIFHFKYLISYKKEANDGMSIRLNCCSIGGCISPSIAYQQRKYEQPVSMKWHLICVLNSFVDVWLLLQAGCMNERMNEWTILCVYLCLWRWIYLEIDVILHHRKFDPQTNRTHNHLLAHTHPQPPTPTHFISIYRCTGTHMFNHQQSTCITFWYSSHTARTISRSNARTGMWPGHRSHNSLLASDKNKMDSHLFREIFLDESWHEKARVRTLCE